MTEPRYKVTKESGSQFAFVVDSKGVDKTLRFNIYKGVGKRNGWERADAVCKMLNDRAATPPTAAEGQP